MQFDCGFKSPLRSSIEIVGTEGTISISNPFKPGLKNEITLTNEDIRETVKIKGQELYLGEVDDMCDAVMNGTSNRVSLVDSRANIAAILALLSSAESGKTARLNDFV